MLTSLPQLILSMILFLILFFGIGFLLNMILRSTWITAFIYPLLVLWIVDSLGLLSYFTAPAASFQTLGQDLAGLQLADVLILTCGLIGAVLAGIVIRMLRVRGYQMF
ncbi:YuiB-like putative membrane protein [Salsuginibacillus halophilus]|uniref:YuiB-like putative membrane protein n=1 Tax=Salsuginibacillus halophilus TaxID=517424 RepID=A0A2P8HE09_9BACI|nr:YuiB family protein [Salsuginibacillus halophilus]PSL44467.1 YuiB-like putative membrane protein [Salsuginibacillus halophilus]